MSETSLAVIAARAAALRRSTVDHDALRRLAASMVPPPPSAWQRLLSQVMHFWLLAAFVIVWECVSVFGLRFNPQLDVMLPPPTAVFSAALDLINRGVLMDAHPGQPLPRAGRRGHRLPDWHPARAGDGMVPVLSPRGGPAARVHPADSAAAGLDSVEHSAIRN